MFCRGILVIGTEIAKPHKLIGRWCLCFFQTCLHFAACQDFKRIGVQTSEKIFSCGIGVGIVEQIAVLPDFCIAAIVCVNPVNGCAFNFSSVRGIAALGFGIISGKYFDNVTAFIGNAAGAGDEICTLQAALGTTGEQPLVLGNCFLQEVVGLDPQIPGESDLVGTGGLIHRIVLNNKGLALTLGIVGDGQLYGLHNSHDTGGSLVQILRHHHM